MTTVEHKAGPRVRMGHRLSRAAVFAAFACVAMSALLLINADVLSNAGARIYRTVDAAPPAPVAVVFGAGYAGSQLSLVLADRVETGVRLYKAGKVHALLMTGDNSRVGYSEPGAMKAAAVHAGVPARNIYCDYAGFHTYDSLYRARDVFGVRRAILVTQTYHLHRALYTARKLGLEVCGVSAERRPYPDQRIYDERELVSRLQAWIDVNVTHPRPKFLGPVVAKLE
ncbi:MAG: vancomycin high temperature exclusion protein [Capsulimonadaceae bacterium]